MTAPITSLLDGFGANARATSWVGGSAWIAGGAAEVIDTSPATGELLAQVSFTGPDGVDAAVAAAATATRGWSELGVQGRSVAIHDLAGRLLAEQETIAKLEALDTGNPLGAMRADVQKGADYLHQCAAAALDAHGDTIPASTRGWHLTLPQPWGVVGAITAYNHPILFACQKAAPALMMGNTIVLKPAEQAPLSSSVFGQLCAESLPPGVVNVVIGNRTAGQALVAHPDVPRLTFTGSLSSGLDVQRTVAGSGRIKSITLELGGKNPIIVAPDCDPAVAAEAVVRGMNLTRVQGQSCGSTSRLLVHEDVHDELIDRVIELSAEIRIGLPLDPQTQMGSLISFDHQQRILRTVERAEDQGGSVVYGGTPPPDRPELARGAFVLPTIVDHVTASMEIARDEVFGPVLAVMGWRTDDEVLALANATEYGLTASIWTRDIDRALFLASGIEAGYVWINDVERRYPGVPFGGWKQSGLGSEQGLVGDILSFSRTKSVNVGSIGEP